MRQHNDQSGMTMDCFATMIVAAAAFVAAAAPASAQVREPLMIDVADCVVIESAAERFRCYEGRVDAALGEASAQARDSAPAADAAPSAQTGLAARPAAPVGGVDAEREIEPERSADADDFGFSRREERKERRERDQEELFGTVASVQETVPNRYVITLENGQVWRQVRPQFYALRPGHRVRIYSTNWGSSYRLSAEELNGFIQVERIR